MLLSHSLISLEGFSFLYFSFFLGLYYSHELLVLYFGWYWKSLHWFILTGEKSFWRKYDSWNHKLYWLWLWVGDKVSWVMKYCGWASGPGPGWAGVNHSLAHLFVLSEIYNSVQTASVRPKSRLVIQWMGFSCFGLSMETVARPRLRWACNQTKPSWCT